MQHAVAFRVARRCIPIDSITFRFERVGEDGALFAVQGSPEVIAACAEVVIRSLGAEAVAAAEAQLGAILAEAEEVVEVSGTD